MELTSQLSPNRALHALPAELIERVACFLLEQDLLSFRLTCRRFHQNSQTAFASTFFTTLSTNLRPHSLQRLQRIAQDDLLRHYVRTVVFASNSAGGQGYHWTRTPGSQFQTQSLDPDVASNPQIGDLQTSLAAFTNLRTLSISDDFGPEREPDVPQSTGLCLLDGIHVALLCAAHLPRLKAFRITRSNTWHMVTHALLPRTVLASFTPSGGWGAHLVHLELGYYPVNGAADQAAQNAVLVGLVQRAEALRKLTVRFAEQEFYALLCSAETLPPLEVLEMELLGGNLTADVMRGVVLRFRDTLRHLYLWSAAVGTGGGWCDVLAGWAVGLARLQSFNLRDLKVPSTTWRMGKVVFDDIAKWEGSDGVPDEGTVQYSSHSVGGGKEGVVGLWFACARGREGDTQRVLRQLAKIARVVVRQAVNPHQVANLQVTPFPKRFVIGGKLEANLMPRLLRAPDLESL